MTVVFSIVEQVRRCRAMTVVFSIVEQVRLCRSDAMSCAVKGAMSCAVICRKSV